MGMDIYGNNPTSNVGEYVRFNVWGWRPLWDYCCLIGKDMISEELKKAGGYNDGAGLETQEECDKLANILQEHIDSGHAKAKEEKWLEDKVKADKWNDHINALYGLLREKVGDKIVPADYNEHHKKLFDRIQSLQNWSSSYPFSVNSVKEFIEFLQECGGFKIN